jgi:hypothetical protein
MIKGDESFKRFGGAVAKLVSLHRDDSFYYDRKRYEGHIGTVGSNGRFYFADVFEEGGTKEDRYFRDGAEFELIGEKHKMTIYRGGERWTNRYVGSLVKLVSLVPGDAYGKNWGYKGAVIGRVFKVQGNGCFWDMVSHRVFDFLSGAKFEIIRKGK